MQFRQAQPGGIEQFDHRLVAQGLRAFYLRIQGIAKVLGGDHLGQQTLALGRAHAGGGIVLDQAQRQGMAEQAAQAGQIAP